MKNSVRVERAKKNITQAGLAELVGVSRQTINSIELNKYIPSTLLALRMSHLFGVSVNEIFELEQEDLIEIANGRDV